MDGLNASSRAGPSLLLNLLQGLGRSAPASTTETGQGSWLDALAAQGLDLSEEGSEQQHEDSESVLAGASIGAASVQGANPAQAAEGSVTDEGAAVRAILATMSRHPALDLDLTLPAEDLGEGDAGDSFRAVAAAGVVPELATAAVDAVPGPVSVAAVDPGQSLASAVTGLDETADPRGQTRAWEAALDASRAKLARPTQPATALAASATGAGPLTAPPSTEATVVDPSSGSPSSGSPSSGSPLSANPWSADPLLVNPAPGGERVQPGRPSDPMREANLAPVADLAFEADLAPEVDPSIESVQPAVLLPSATPDTDPAESTALPTNTESEAEVLVQRPRADTSARLRASLAADRRAGAVERAGGDEVEDAEEPAGDDRLPGEPFEELPAHAQRRTALGARSTPGGAGAQPPTFDANAQVGEAELARVRDVQPSEARWATDRPDSELLLGEDLVEVPELSVADLDELELELRDRDSTIRVSLVREAERVAVEVQAPRDALEDLEQAESEIDQALAEEGFNLSSYSAREDGGDGSGRQPAARRDREPESKPAPALREPRRVLSRIA